MRHIDAFCHFFPQSLFEKMSQTAGGTKDIGKRMQGVRNIHDLDARLRMMDEFADYSEILSLGLPPLEGMAGPDKAPEFARVANDGLAELCAKYPDRFAGYVGALPMSAPDAAARRRSAFSSTATPTGCSFIPTSTATASTSRASFRSSRSRPRRASRYCCIRRAWPNVPDFPAETKSKYEIWADPRLALRDQLHHGAADLLRRDHAAAEPEDARPSPRRDDPVLRCAPRHRLGHARQPHLGRGLQRRAQDAGQAADATASRISTPTPRSAAAASERCAGSNSTAPIMCCSPRTRRSAPRAGRAISARP